MGFRHGWDVNQTYEIALVAPAKGGKRVRVLRSVEADGIRRFYLPAVEPNIVEDFAEVCNEEQLKRFAQRFGLLHQLLVQPPDAFKVTTRSA